MHNFRRGICLSLLTMVLVACSQSVTSSPTNPGSLAGSAVDGEELYLKNCAECHGEQGEGQPNWQVPDAEGVYPAPPHDSTGHTWHHPDAQLLQIIAEGGSMPSTNMPGFAEQLSQAEMEAILAHIKTFWGESERQMQEMRSNQ